MTAKEMVECRFDLIEKVDGSTVGWSVTAFYEKTNGLVLKPESEKLWVEAEKSAQSKEKETAPFVQSPVGQADIPISSLPEVSLFPVSYRFLVPLFYLYAFPDWYIFL